MATTPAGQPPVVSAETMRDVLGHFCSGITVIAAIGPDGPAGFTCQSFTSLSLEPALVSFAPARTSSSWPKLRAVRRLWVNVLADDQEHVAKAFARSGTDKFAGIEWCPSRHGAPVLDGVVAWIDCELWAEYDGGDHTVVVASVIDLGVHPTRAPLLFHRGAYGLQNAVTHTKPATRTGPD